MYLSILIIFLALFTVPNSWSSYCITPEVPQAFDRAKAVFIGEVEEITAPRSQSADAKVFERAYLVQFKIEKSWKGQPFGSLKVWTFKGNQASSVLPAASKGERYLVYADPFNSGGAMTGELVVGSCNRTALLPRNAEAPRYSLFNVPNAAQDVRALDSLMFLKRR